jgi:hypothetical protein
MIIAEKTRRGVKVVGEIGALQDRRHRRQQDRVSVAMGIALSAKIETHPLILAKSMQQFVKVTALAVSESGAPIKSLSLFETPHKERGTSRVCATHFQMGTYSVKSPSGTIFARLT